MSLRDQLQDIYDQHGSLTPDLLVEEARPKNHPLHDRVFDRAPREAAEAWYRYRAHELIQSVRVVYKEADEQTPDKSIRAWHAVPGPDRQVVYEPHEKVAQDDFMRALVLRNMERDWKQLQRRYGDFEEFVALVRSGLAEAA